MTDPLWYPIAYYLSLIVIGIGAHEIGHFLVAKAKGLNPKIGVDKKGLYVEHEPADKEATAEIIGGGLLLGMITIPLAVLYSSDFALFWVIGFGLGNAREIIKWIRLKKEVEN